MEITQKIQDAYLLVVDDDLKNLQLLGKMLSGHGYQIGFARDGKQAIKAAKLDPPDLILLDVNMPGLNGFETCAELKRSSNTKEIPIIFLTAKTTTEELIQGFEVGAIDYITKPYNYIELLARIQTHLQLKFSKKELSERTQELERSLDILKNTQEQLIVQKKIASLGTLTAGIAHELKNPLNFINNYSDFCVNVGEDLRSKIVGLPPEDQRDVEELLDTLSTAATAIHKHGQKADDVIKAMLRHARQPSSGNQEADLNKLLEEYLEMALKNNRLRAPNFNVSISLELSPELPDLIVSAADLGTAFLNILDNALHSVLERQKKSFGDFAPVVGIITKNFDSHVEVCIWDNGGGIPQENMEQIFEPFFTTKPPGSGTGLGLSLSHDIIVKGHQGSVKVHSSENELTEFLISFPKDSTLSVEEE